MATSEFDIIRRYFSRVGKKQNWLSVGIGDDAAVITPDPDSQLLISVDTLNAGVHFPEHSSASDVGYKALAVNLSDIAAMGGEPKWFTLALSLPSADEDWLTAFCQGLSVLVEQYQLCLVGGDTTRGSLSITIQIAGVIPQHQALSREGAMLNDDVYVSGQLGDAAVGLMICQQALKVNEQAVPIFMDRLNRPQPRVELGMALRQLANACIDISDGLAADLGHILEASGVGAEIYPDRIPVSAEFAKLELDAQKKQDCMLYGGDDYELCFTAAPDKRDTILDLAARVGINVTRIGQIINEDGLFAVEKDQRGMLPEKGYDHFQNK